MEAFIYYLLKTGGLLLLFLACYQLLLRKNTLFHFNRVFLLTGLLLSFSLPLIEITKTIPISIMPAHSTPTAISDTIGTEIVTWLTFYRLGLVLYIIGVLLSLSKRFAQGIQLRHIIKNGHRIKYQKFYHVHTKAQIHPFSFFSFIVYNPDKHSENELAAILAHEEVHAGQIHSLDILLMELVVVLQWFNLVVRLYSIALKQNLEFLADRENHHIKENKKDYQYTLLKQVIETQPLFIVNPFFNSLIKKRIVMINQNPSPKSTALKSLITLPLLALFLVSFNVKTDYVFSTIEKQVSTTATIELVIDKNTTDEELLKIKNDLASEKFDFSYTTVRNSAGEIQNISLEISGGNPNSGEVSSRYTSASDNDTIDSTFIVIDTDNNSISIGQRDRVKTPKTNTSTRIKKDTGKSTKSTTIVIENTQNKHKDAATPHLNSDSKKQLSINTSTSENHDIEILEEEGNGFIRLATDNGQEPLYFVNGKKTESKSIQKINPSTVKSVNVLKGDAAVKKYGESAKHGAVEIMTKK